MTEEELDAAVDVISAVDAGVLQSLNQRIKQRSIRNRGTTWGPQNLALGLIDKAGHKVGLLFALRWPST